MVVLIKINVNDQKYDNVNHPYHYKQGKREVIEIIEDLTNDSFEGFLIGNIIKYIARYKYKNGLEDLKKAKWYLDKLISCQENACE